MEEFQAIQVQERFPEKLTHNPNQALTRNRIMEKCFYRKLIFTNPQECLRQKRIKNYQGLYEQEAFHVPFSKVRKQLLATTRSSSQKQTMYIHLEFCTISEVERILSRLLPKHSNLRGLHLIFSDEITFSSWRKIGRLISRFSHLNSFIVNFHMKRPEMNDLELAKMHRFINMLPRLTNLGFAVTHNENDLLHSGFLRAGYIPNNNHKTEGMLSKFTSRFKKLESMHLKVMGQDALTDIGLIVYAKALSELPKIQDLSLKLYDCRRVTNQGLNTYLDYLQISRNVKKLSMALNICEDNIDTKNLPIMHPIWTNNKLTYGSLEIKFSYLFLSETLNAAVNEIEKISCLGRLVLNLHGMTWEANKAIEKIPFIVSKLPILTDLTIRFINGPALDRNTANNMIYGINSCPRLKKATIEFVSCFKKIEGSIPEIEDPLVSRPNLKELNLIFVDCAELQEKQVNRIVEILTHCENLEVLTLQVNWCKGLFDEQYQKFIRVMSAMQYLRYLTWSFEGLNKITRNSAIPFGKMITRFTLLQYLDLNLAHFCEVEDVRMPIIGEWFSQMKNLEVFKLTLKGCKLVTDEGIKTLCLNMKGLRKIGTILIVWNSNNIRELSKTLVGHLAANLPNLYCAEFHAVKKNGQTSKVCIRLSP